MRLEKPPRKIRHCVLKYMSHGNVMYINAVAKGVMLLLYSWHDSLNIIFKIKHKLHITSGSSPSPPWKIWGAHVVTFQELFYFTHSSVLRPFRKTAHTCSSSWLILIAFCEVRPGFKCDVVWFSLTIAFVGRSHSWYFEADDCQVLPVAVCWILMSTSRSAELFTIIAMTHERHCVVMLEDSIPSCTQLLTGCQQM